MNIQAPKKTVKLKMTNKSKSKRVKTEVTKANMNRAKTSIRKVRANRVRVNTTAKNKKVADKANNHIAMKMKRGLRRMSLSKKAKKSRNSHKSLISRLIDP